MSGLSERVRVFDQIRRAKPELPSDFIKKLITVWLKLLTRIDQLRLIEQQRKEIEKLKNLPQN